MYHSITFGDKNTWDDWHLVSQVRPFFVPPTQKTKHVDIPGASGFLDLSESLTGYPVYNNREGSFEFLILNGYSEWYDIYSEIMNYLSGKTLRAILEDEKDFFYEGQFWVSDYKPGSSASEQWSSITISYSVNPYKWSLQSTTDEWLWDPFNFNTGIIRTPLFKNIQIKANMSGSEHIEYYPEEFGSAPVYPEITVKSVYGNGMNLQFYNAKLNINITKHFPDGTTSAPEFIFYGDAPIHIGFTGSGGTVSIDFRVGRL